MTLREQHKLEDQVILRCDSAYPLPQGRQTYAQAAGWLQSRGITMVGPWFRDEWMDKARRQYHDDLNAKQKPQPRYQFRILRFPTNHVAPIVYLMDGSKDAYILYRPKEFVLTGKPVSCLDLHEDRFYRVQFKVPGHLKAETKARIRDLGSQGFMAQEMKIETHERQQLIEAGYWDETGWTFLPITGPIAMALAAGVVWLGNANDFTFWEVADPRYAG